MKIIKIIIKSIISIILLIIMAYIILVLLVLINQRGYGLNISKFYIIILIYCISATIFLMTWIYTIYSERLLRKYIKIYFISILVLYILTLINVRYLNYSIRFERFSYLSENMNFIPFKSILYYINRHNENYVTTTEFITNILGNLLSFAPMGLFLPIFFNKLLKFKWYIPILFGICVISEILQPIISYGRFDIDDVILQFIGGVIVFVIFKLPPLQKLFVKCNIINQ